MHQRSDHTVIGVMHFIQIIAAGLTSQPFLVISPFCFMQIMRLSLNPFTFSSPETMPWMNLFLCGKTVSLCDINVNQQ
jgi:hypothetical protein